jgi:hypothetical protein
LCSILDWHHLVTNGREDGRKEDDEIWLDGRGGFGMLRNGLDGIESAFSSVGILLVAKLLLQGFDGSASMVISIVFEIF